ncbi:hypothetical protein [Paractinoplanes lichenicola]|uniref:Uncharacterized protein n=1 Tax=Paractinoplanes lichenicola TaxID=2802976 RepID=A0ABS1W600_9ACTN|nr:hypothetical protein [Actinoplanes lichenicola]MBL7262161.1 hypothetical protein [Actinoplanes lichenicola]
MSTPLPPAVLQRWYVVAPAALALGVVIGAVAGSLFEDDHTASPRSVTATVGWSNEETHLLSLAGDEKGDDQTFYYVVADNLNYPECLRGSGGNPVREDERRVRMEVIDVAYGDNSSAQKIAVSVDCL